MDNEQKLESFIKNLLSENPEGFKEKLNSVVSKIQNQNNSINEDDIRYHILSINNYSIFEWAIEKNDIKILEMLFSLLSKEQIIETLEFDSNTLFQKFLSIQYTKILLNDFDQDECIIGINFFLEKYGNSPEFIINDTDHTIDNYIKDYNELKAIFQSSIQVLLDSNAINSETFNNYVEAIGDLTNTSD